MKPKQPSVERRHLPMEACAFGKPVPGLLGPFSSYHYLCFKGVIHVLSDLKSVGFCLHTYFSLSFEHFSSVFDSNILQLASNVETSGH